MKTDRENRTEAQALVAGVIRARCTCCADPRPLKADSRLGANQLLCPTSGQVYLDRGDGWFEPEGRSLSGPAQPIQASEPQALGDRPVRSGEKTRIELESATFA